MIVYVRIRKGDGTASKKIVTVFPSPKAASDKLGIGISSLYKVINKPLSINQLVLSTDAEHKMWTYKASKSKRYAIYDFAGNIIKDNGYDSELGYTMNSLILTLRNRGVRLLNGIVPSALGIKKKLAGMSGVWHVFMHTHVKSVKPFMITPTIKIDGYRKCSGHMYYNGYKFRRFDTNVPGGHFTVNSNGNLSSRCLCCKGNSLYNFAMFIKKMQNVFKSKYDVDVPETEFSYTMYVKYYNAFGCFDSTPWYDEDTKEVYTSRVNVEYNGVFGSFSSIYRARLHFTNNNTDNSPLDRHNRFIRECSSITYVRDYKINSFDNENTEIDPEIEDYYSYFMNNN